MVGCGIKIGTLIVYLTYFPYKSLGLSVNFTIIAPPAVINKTTNMHIFTNISMYLAINILYRYAPYIKNISYIYRLYLLYIYIGMNI